MSHPERRSCNARFGGAMFIDLEPPKKRCLDRCGENPTALRASIRWREKLKFVSANKSRTEVGWNACN
jgi:hypothetical protein